MVDSTNTDKTMHRRGTLGYKLVEQYLKPLKNAELVSVTSFPESVSVYQEGRVSDQMMRLTDAEYWKILDFSVISGRVINDDDVAHGRMVAVLNESTARKLFPGLPYLGQKFSANGQTFTVIGVVRDEMHLNAYADIWTPVSAQPSSDYKNKFFGQFGAILMARSADDLPALKKEIIAVAKTVQYEDPTKFNIFQFWGDSKLSLFSRMLLSSEAEDGDVGTLLAIIVTLMLLFMALPALNLVNLNVGRIMERSSEIGVRKAFGATSRQLVAQLVLENVLLCLIGGAIGLVCAAGVLWWLEGSGLIPYLTVHLNLAVFGYGLLITLVFGVLSGVIPAWKMSRLAPVHALKGTA
jgi:putative ABC transport system permease protein